MYPDQSKADSSHDSLLDAKIKSYTVCVLGLVAVFT